MESAGVSRKTESWIALFRNSEPQGAAQVDPGLTSRHLSKPGTNSELLCSGWESLPVV